MITQSTCGQRRWLAVVVSAVAATTFVLAAASGAAGAAVVRGPRSVTPATAAGTQQVVESFDDICAFPALGPVVIPTSITETAPSSVSPGSSFDLTDVQVTATLPPVLVGLLRFVTPSVSGSVTRLDFDVAGGSPSVIDAVSSPIAFGPVPLQFGHSAAITFPSTPMTVGPFTAGQSGQVSIGPGLLSVSTLVGQVTCSPSRMTGSSASVVIDISSTALPVGTIGGAGVAGVAGLGFAARQRRRRPLSGRTRRSHASTSPTGEPGLHVAPRSTQR